MVDFSYILNLGVCRMTLLLGPPSSGKTTLLLALADKLDPGLKVRVLIITIFVNLRLSLVSN